MRRALRGSVLLAYVVLIAWLALRPPAGGAAGLPGVDKLLHAAAFAVMMGLAHWSMGRNRAVQAAITCLALGFLIEAAQFAMSFGREASVGDLAANAVGIFIGFLVWRALGRVGAL